MSRQWQLPVRRRAESRRPVRGSAPCLHNVQQTEGSRGNGGNAGYRETMGNCGSTDVKKFTSNSPIVLRRRNRYTSNVQRTLQSAWSLLLGHSAAPRSWHTGVKWLWPFTASVLPFASDKYSWNSMIVTSFFSFAHFCTSYWALACCNCVLETWAFETLDLIRSAQTLDCFLCSTPEQSIIWNGLWLTKIRSSTHSLPWSSDSHAWQRLPGFVPGASIFFAFRSERVFAQALKQAATCRDQQKPGRQHAQRRTSHHSQVSMTINMM